MILIDSQHIRRLLSRDSESVRRRFGFTRRMLAETAPSQP